MYDVVRVRDILRRELQKAIRCRKYIQTISFDSEKVFEQQHAPVQIAYRGSARVNQCSSDDVASRQSVFSARANSQKGVCVGFYQKTSRRLNRER